jgi:excisionase family DNA binding protein
MNETAVATERRYLSYQEAAAYIGISTSSLRRAVGEGRLKVYRPSPARVVFDQRELDELVRGSGEGA